MFSELVSHYLFKDRFGRPGKGNDKGKVEGMVGYTRRNFMVPKPRFASFDDLNEYLAEQCRTRMADKLRGHPGTIGERFERDAEQLQPLPAIAYDACDKQSVRVSSLSLVRYRGNDYSVPTSYGHRQVLVRGYVHEVVIACGKRWSDFFDQFTASLRWIRFTFRLPISLVVFCFHRPLRVSIFHGSNAVVQYCSMPTIFQSLRGFLIQFQMR